MPESDAQSFRRDALGYDALLHPEKYGIIYSYKGKEKIEGKDYFILEQTFSGGHIKTHYVDSETYLTYKTKTTTLSAGTDVEVEAEVFISDYKEVDGVMIAHTTTTFLDGEGLMKMNFTEVKFNTGLEDSLFKMSK